MVHPYLVYQTLYQLTIAQLRQLGADFKLNLPSKASKKQLVALLMKRNKQRAGGRTETDADQEEEFRRLRQTRMEKFKPVVEYYKELCKNGTPVEDQTTLDSLTATQIPFVDPFTNEPLEVNDIVFIHNQCVSKRHLTEWVETFKDKTTKPTDPQTRKEYTLAEIKELGLSIRDFRHTYSKEVPLSPEEISEQAAIQARQQRARELQQRQRAQQEASTRREQEERALRERIISRMIASMPLNIDVDEQRDRIMHMYARHDAGERQLPEDWELERSMREISERVRRGQ